MANDDSQRKRSRKSVFGEGDDVNGTGEIDRISNLPEGVLDKIISFLTTKEAMRTSVLSKYWVEQWTYNCNVIIDDSEFFRPENITAGVFFRHEAARNLFSSFMDRALHVNVKNLHISFEKNHDFSHLISFISDMVSGCKVESIKLSCAKKYIVFLLPSNLFNCTSLTDLELKLCYTITPPVNSLLPNLKILKLDYLDIQNQNCHSDRLHFTFPVLETCIVKYCRWLDVKYVEFNVPNLTNFHFTTYSHPLGEFGQMDCTINIVGACRLTKFEFDGMFLNIILSECQVTCALVSEICPPKVYHQLKSLGLNIRKLLRGFSCVEKLDISGGMMMAIAQSKGELPLLDYYKLEHLVLHNWMPDVSAVFELLQSMPMLKSLEIDLNVWDIDHVDAFDYNAMECVPPCFINSLAKVTFDLFFRKRYDNISLLEFVLKNGVKLREAIFFIHPSNVKYKVKEELSRYPRGSPHLNIKIC